MATMQPVPVTAAADLLQGSSGLLLGYGGVTACIIIGLALAHAPLGRYLAAPLLAVVVVLIGAIFTWLIGLVLPHGLAMGLSAAFDLAFAFALGRWTPPSGDGVAHHRGTRLETADAASKPASPGWDGTLTLAGISVAPLDETKHFKFIGTTGTGKSTAIRELLGGALHRGDRAVIADPDGGYLQRFYAANRGDVILNPFEPRSLKWDLFAEIRNPYDFDQLARSLIPDGAGDDRPWRQYGQTFVAATMRQAHACRICDLTEFHRLLTTAPPDELRMLLEGTPAAPYLAAGNDKMFGSTRSVVTTAVAPLSYISTQEAAGFSIRRWIQEGRGVLFLPYRADQIAALRGLISTWMRIAIFETMSLSEGDAKLWFVVDELDALGAIDGLKDALARLRKFGGRCILGLQSIAQVSGTYGRAEAETIIENCGNTLILRCSASEGGGTAQFASRLIGDREIIREQISRSRRPDEWLPTTSSSDHHHTEAAVMASEIEQLPDLTGYLKLASRSNWSKVQL